MVNVDFSPALLLGMSLIAGGLALYQLRRLQPDISRDFDVIVSAVATFSGGILIFQVGIVQCLPVRASQYGKRGSRDMTNWIKTLKPILACMAPASGLQRGQANSCSSGSAPSQQA